MFKKYDLRKARVGTFNGVLTGGYATDVDGVSKTVIYAELNENSIKEITCLVDLENENVIDIFTGEVFHILQRDNKRRVIEKIESNRYYVLSIENIEVKTESQLYNIYLNYMATQAKSKYNKDKQQKSHLYF